MRLPAPDSELAPSDNEWGVPLLDASLQPDAVTAPVVPWGSVARTTRHGGVWHFYVDDARFTRARLAEQVANTLPAAVVEPNFSIFDWTPRAEALWSVYRKRRVAWQLQRRGIPVFVDVCMPEHVHDLALLGVPVGWRAYATRGFEARAADVAREYGLAANHCGARPLLLVVGGGAKVRSIVGTLPGAVHVTDHMTQRLRDG